MRSFDFLKLSVVAALLGLAATLLLTRAVDVSLAGEPWSSAYGYPFLWHAQGSTSLSRQVNLGALLLDWLTHGALLLVICSAAKWFVPQLLSSRAVNILLGASVLAALACLLLAGAQFLDIEWVPTLQHLTPIETSSRFHFGFSYR